MKAKFITFRINKDQSACLYLGKLTKSDEHELTDLKEEEVEIKKPTPETESEQYSAGIEAGRNQMYDAFKRFLEAEAEIKGGK